MREYPAADIEAGRLVWTLGFAPLEPAEFVVLRMEKSFVENSRDSQ